MADSWVGYVVLFGCGLIAGTLNVMAGGGSFLTLPILILLGLPATTANGTNRVGILLQNVGAVWGFRRHGVLERGRAWRAAIPAATGAIAGTAAALVIPDGAFRRVLAFLMIVVTLWTLWDPAKRIGARRIPEWALAIGFFGVGVYGGFVQAGVGFLILALTTMIGLDLVRGNALKVFLVLVFTSVSLALFAWQGQVHWGLGVVLAAGTVLGGQLGVRLTVLKGHRWIRGVVTVTVVILAIRLWLVP